MLETVFVDTALVKGQADSRGPRRKRKGWRSSDQILLNRTVSRRFATLRFKGDKGDRRDSKGEDMGSFPILYPSMSRL